MERFTILKNKGELFKCQLNIEGAGIHETTVRLCLEFDDNKNMHFYGKLEKGGICTIEIPKLEELNKENGKLIIEVIADSMFFKLYECEVDFKNSVEVKMVHKETTVSKARTSSDKKIGLSGLVQERAPVEPEKKPEIAKNPYVQEKIEKPVEYTDKGTAFEEWLNKRKKK